MASAQCQDAPLAPLNLTINGTCEVVVSVYSDAENLRELPSLVPPQCAIVVYDRRDAGVACNHAQLPPGARCQRLGNVGKDMTHTWVYYSQENYDRLPDYVIAVSASLQKRQQWRWLRKAIMATGFGASDRAFACVPEVRQCDFSETFTRPPATLGDDDYYSKNMSQYFDQTGEHEHGRTRLLRPTSRTRACVTPCVDVPIPTGP